MGYIVTKPQKIVAHWTAGYGYPNNEELEHYHYVIDREGKVHIGHYKPEDNNNCQDGKYAMHCGGGNTGAIGVALCGMLHFDSKTKKSDCDLNITQFDSLYHLVRNLLDKYKIILSKSTVYTHAEFGLANPNTESAHKIDIIYIPHLKLYGIKECGDEIRKGIKTIC